MRFSTPNALHSAYHWLGSSYQGRSLYSALSLWIRDSRKREMGEVSLTRIQWEPIVNEKTSSDCKCERIARSDMIE